MTTGQQWIVLWPIDEAHHCYREKLDHDDVPQATVANNETTRCPLERVDALLAEGLPSFTEPLKAAGIVVR